jgi:hypothetical protein
MTDRQRPHDARQGLVSTLRWVPRSTVHLSSNVVEQFHLARAREDGRMLQGGMTDEEFLALADAGYMCLRPSASEEEQAQWAKRFARQVASAKTALRHGDWERAYTHLSVAKQLDLALQTSGWFLTERGRAVVADAAGTTAPARSAQESLGTMRSER